MTGEPGPTRSPEVSIGNRDGAPAGLEDAAQGPPLWVSIWQMNRAPIGVTVAAILVLTAIFFFQNTLARRPRLLKGVRYGYLAFTLVWLGWIANTQLSVVNVLTFINALVTGFSWEFFLSAPLIFILWAAVAAGLLFWGRGPFCGWLCPFGALQEFLSQHRWDTGRLRDRLQQLVVRDHTERHSIGVIDETSFVKKGDKTPGVQRQHCGAVGKQENCIVTVHLGYAVGDFHCLVDADLFLPESWSEDRDRCREAGIPDDVVYRPKSEIALELHDRATTNGIAFEWLTFDEWYGAKPQFLRALDARGQKFVGEVHKHYTAWIDPPQTTGRAYRRGGRGRGKKVPRLVSRSRPPHGLRSGPTSRPIPTFPGNIGTALRGGRSIPPAFTTAPPTC